MTTTAARLGRRLRMGVIAAVVLGGLGWVGRSVYLRVTLDPPGYDPNGPKYFGLLREPDSAEGQTLWAVAYLVRDPPYRYTPPETPSGMRWKYPGRGGSFVADGERQQLGIEDALRGVWTPDTRPNLQAAIAFLEEPETRALIAALLAVAEEGWQPAPDSQVARYRSGYSAAAMLLALDARYQLETRHDPQAAWADLRAQLALVTPLARGAILPRLAYKHSVEPVLESIRCDAAVLPPELCDEIEQILQTLPRAGDGWETCIDRETLLVDEFLDLKFTRLPNGNGWYVLTTTYWEGQFGGCEFGHYLPPNRRARVWDLSSYVYNDRRTVAAKLKWFLTTARGLDDAPYRTTCATFEAALADAPVFTAADGGALTIMQSDLYLQGYQQCLEVDAEIQATRLALALTRYRRAYGAWPTTAAALVPEFLPAVPADPFADRPLSCRVEPDNTYVIWSWGLNGADDGAVGGRTNRWSRDDLIFIADRPEPEFELELRLAPVDAD